MADDTKINVDDTNVADSSDALASAGKKFSESQSKLSSALNNVSETTSSVKAIKSGVEQIKKANQEFETADEKAQDMTSNGQYLSFTDAYELVKQEEVDKNTLSQTKAQMASTIMVSGASAVGNAVEATGDIVSAVASKADGTVVGGLMASGGAAGALGYFLNKSDTLSKFAENFDFLAKNNEVDSDVDEKSTPGAETKESIVDSVSEQYKTKQPANEDEEADEKDLDVDAPSRQKTDYENDIFNQTKDDQQNTLDDIAADPSNYNKDAVSQIANGNGEIDFENSDFLANLGQDMDKSDAVKNVTDDLYSNIPGGDTLKYGGAAFKALNALKEASDAKDDKEQENDGMNM